MFGLWNTNQEYKFRRVIISLDVMYMYGLAANEIENIGINLYNCAIKVKMKKFFSWRHANTGVCVFRCETNINVLWKCEFVRLPEPWYWCIC